MELWNYPYVQQHEKLYSNKTAECLKEQWELWVFICFWLFLLKTRNPTTLVAMKNSGLAVTREGTEWHRIFPQKRYLHRSDKIWKILAKVSFTELVFIWPGSVCSVRKALFEGICPRKKKFNSNHLTLQLLIAVMPSGQTRDWTKHLQEKFEEWDAHRELWKVHAQYWKSRKPWACTELCLCPRKTWAGPNLSALVDLKAQYK